jgi:hypothetical protein
MKKTKSPLASYMRTTPPASILTKEGMETTKPDVQSLALGIQHSLKTTRAKNVQLVGKARPARWRLKAVANGGPRTAPKRYGPSLGRPRPWVAECRPGLGAFERQSSLGIKNPKSASALAGQFDCGGFPGWKMGWRRRIFRG